jgi:hypothetical protein
LSSILADVGIDLESMQDFCGCVCCYKVWDPFCCALQLTRRSLPIVVQCAAARRYSANTALRRYTLSCNTMRDCRSRERIDKYGRLSQCLISSFTTSILHPTPYSSIPTIDQTKNLSSHIDHQSTTQLGKQPIKNTSSHQPQCRPTPSTSSPPTPPTSPAPTSP